MRARKGWSDLRDSIIARYDEPEIPAKDSGPTLERWSEGRGGQANYKSRGKDKGLWEI